jgi:hypothetical protein
MKISLIVSAMVLLGGCVSAPSKTYIEDTKNQVKSMNWERGYRDLEDALTSENSALKKEALDLVKEYPSIRLAAVNSFTPTTLRESFKNWGLESGFIREKERLKYFSSFATPEEVITAANNIDKVYRDTINIRSVDSAAQRTLGKGLLVNNFVFKKLAVSDQESFNQKYPLMEVFDIASAGKVASYQIINRSIARSDAGSRLGSTIGQAAYIDTAIPSRNYSALGQVGAALIGAAIGESLNRLEEKRFIINYGVQLIDGTIKTIPFATSDESASSVGQCVWTSNISEAPAYICSDTLVGFLGRAKLSLIAESITAGSLDQVKCRIGGLGVVAVLADDCKALKGTISD